MKLLNVAYVPKPTKQEYSFSPTEYIVHTHTATTTSSVRHIAGKYFTLSLLLKALQLLFQKLRTTLTEKRQRMDGEEITPVEEP